VLTVLGVSYALAPPVGPDVVGGAEQVLWLVDRALAAARHRSVVVAPEGSRLTGELVPTPAAAGPFGAAERVAAERAHRAAIAAVLASLRVDLVHLHGLDFASILPGGARAIAALHLPPAWYPPRALAAPPGDVSFVCVSESQAAAVPAGVRIAAVIPNGVPLDVFQPGGAKEPFALVLARICPEKGIAQALRAAHAVDVPLLLCGRAFPYPEHLRYADEEVKPLLDRRRRAVGPVARPEKARLLAAARCLVVPSLAPETSSLAAMEALASGTPVVARRIGALPEIVEDGRTGFLVDRDEELGPAIREAARLSPAHCRRAAEQRFSAADAGRRWVDLFGRMARRPPRSPRAGRRVEAIAGLGALEAIRSEWSALADRAAGTPFQRPEWLVPFCRAFGVTAPFAIAVRAAGRLVALAPLVAYRDGAARRVTLLGGGISDYQDALVDPSLGPALGPELLAEVLARAPDAEELLLEHLPDGSPLLTRPPGPGAEQDGVCPVLALPPHPASWDALAAPGLAEDVRYGQRRLRRAGATITTAGPSDLDAHLEALFALHGARWSARGEAGVLAAPALRRFHAESARGMLALGLLRLHVLWVDRRPVAAFHGFVDRGRAYYYLGGFDPAHRAASPGAVLIAHAIQAARSEGAQELDFLRGGEAYKYAWGARDRPTWRRVLPIGSRRSPGAPGVINVE
jgi:CelD/BcsL family acetyltransferase involved in cellulose biosynthesis/glycosyltransferase involved in cell wall biosynthesis